MDLVIESIEQIENLGFGLIIIFTMIMIVMIFVYILVTIIEFIIGV